MCNLQYNSWQNAEAGRAKFYTFNFFNFKILLITHDRRNRETRTSTTKFGHINLIANLIANLSIVIRHVAFPKLEAGGCSWELSNEWIIR